MLCLQQRAASMHRSRASDQCDLEHPNVNDIRRNGKLPANRPAAGGRARPQWNSWRAFAPWRVVQVWAARRSQRRTLGELAGEKHLLDDIGLTRAQALDEAAKPFWRQ